MQAVEVVYATVPGCPAPSTLRDKLRAFALAFFREAPPDFHADLVLQIDNFAFQYTPTHSLLSDLPNYASIACQREVFVLQGSPPGASQSGAGLPGPSAAFLQMPRAYCWGSPSMRRA